MPIETIIFEPLTGASPETDGGGGSALPGLRSMGHQQPNTGLGLLPPLRSLGDGFEVVAFLGVANASLPRMISFGAEAGASYGVGTLPGLASRGSQSALPIPQDGVGSASLALLTSDGTVARGDTGAGAGRLPAMRSIGWEPAGDAGSGSLPLLRGAGAEAAPTYEAFLISTLEGPAASLLGTNDLILTAGVTPSDSAMLQHVVPAIEKVALAAEARSALQALIALQDGCALADVATLVRQLVAVEAIDTVDAVGVLRRQIERVVDAVILLGDVESKLVAREAVTAAIALEAIALRGWQFDETESATFRAEAMQTLRQVQALVESIDTVAVADMTARFTLLLDEAVALEAVAASNARFFELLQDGAAFHAAFALRGERYVAWALNAKTGAGVSRYEGFGFNSFAAFEVGGMTRYFGAMDDGVHQLGGDTDNGAPIAAKVRSAMANFGTTRMKRMAMIYLGLTCDGELVLKQIITSPKGVKEAFWYTLEGRPAQALREDRVKPDGGLESVYWQWELTNVDGANFNIDTMAFVPMVISRSV